MTPKFVCFQDCESSLKQKTELVKKLEAKSASIAETFRDLDAKYQKMEKERHSCEKSNLELHMQLEEREAMRKNAEKDLEVEREWRTALQSSTVEDRDRISHLTQELRSLRETAEKYEDLKEEMSRLQSRCTEQEQTLEEVGIQLSVSRLKVIDLQEEVRAKTESQWAADRDAQNCRSCVKEFNLTRRRHHCRYCGGIFCNACSDNTIKLSSSAHPVRVCNDCHVYLIGKNSLL